MLIISQEGLNLGTLLSPWSLKAMNGSPHRPIQHLNCMYTFMYRIDELLVNNIYESPSLTSFLSTRVPNEYALNKTGINPIFLL